MITAGVKAADYQMVLNQYQDNSNGKKGVGCLGGTLTTFPPTAGIWAGAPDCVGGVAFVTHSINYNNWLPTLTARYRIWKQWSTYAEFAEGSVIPLSSVFDVLGGNVLVPPKPTVAKTYQAGSVLKLNRFTLDMDAYYVHFQNGYDTYTDPNTGEPVNVATGPSNTKGIEAEGNVPIAYGVSIYGNLSFGSAKYQARPQLPERRPLGGEYAR